MRGKLWCLRLILLILVSAVVFSPLAVRGASLASQPVGWNHDPSTLLLPSAPTYPAVVAYRDIRMRMTERSFEKADLLLSFANQDAAAISTMARRQDFVTSANHASIYQQTFDRCVGWLVIADERGNDVSYLLSTVKNDHIAQQVALGQTLTIMPDWSQQSIQSARRHAAEVLTEAIRIVEGIEAAQSYVRSLGSMLPELELPEVTLEGAAPSVVVVAPQVSAPAQVDSAETTEETSAPTVIRSLRAESTSVQAGDSVRVTCELSSGDDDGLRFSWWCSRGDLVASRTRATWTAPHRIGMHEISVTVLDESGRSDTYTIEVYVTDDGDNMDDTEGDGQQVIPESVQPAPDAASPEITGVTVTADHKYLEQSLGGGYSILVSRECTIRCDVADSNALDIAWTVTGGGQVLGGGDTVTFKAPATPGYSRITVTATNSDGQQDSTTITLYVTTCTYCF